MVIRERKYVAIEQAETIIRESDTVEEAIEKLRSLPARQPNPPAPDGGISVRDAGRKYGIPHPTISRWIKKGYCPILLKTKSQLYVDEAQLIQLVNIYKSSPGQGKYTVRQMLNKQP